jgi:hypothetical protein
VADDNNLNIYIKPAVAADEYFDHIYDWLVQRGVGGMTYVVEKGTPLKFSILVRLFGSIAYLNLVTVANQISKELTTRYAYRNIPFRETVSVLEIAQIVQTVLPGLRTLVELTVEEELKVQSGVMRTSLPPIKGTIISNRWVDYDGGIYQPIVSAMQIERDYTPILPAGYQTNDRYFRFGDSLICSYDSANVYPNAWNPVTESYQSTPRITPLPSKIGIPSDGGTIPFITQIKTWQSPYRTVLLNNKDSEIYQTQAFNFSSGGALYAASKLFTVDVFSYKNSDLWTNRMIYPATFANLVLKCEAGSNFMYYYSLDWNPTLLQEDLREVSNDPIYADGGFNPLTGTDKGKGRLAMIQVDNVVYLFVVSKAGVLNCEAFSYENDSIYRKSRDNIAIELTSGSFPNMVGDVALHIGTQYLFIKSAVDKSLTAYKWEIDKTDSSRWVITLNPMGETLVNMPTFADDLEIWLTHDGDTLVERLIQSPSSGPHYGIHIYTLERKSTTDSTLVLTADRGTGNPVYSGTGTVRAQALAMQGQVNYDTGVISLNSFAQSTTTITYRVSDVALLSTSKAFPVFAGVKVIQGE